MGSAKNLSDAPATGSCRQDENQTTNDQEKPKNNKTLNVKPGE
jgi:hypothetical protein